MNANAFRARARTAGLTALLAALALLPAPAAQDGGKDGPQEPQEKDKKEEVKDAKSTTAEVGKPAPAFELKTVDGKTIKLSDSKDKIVVLEWFCPTCPFCVFAYGEKGPLRKMPEELQAKGVVWLTIVSEKPENPGAKAETIRKFAEENAMKLPILLDPDGKVGRSYGAKCTPHMFVIDAKGVLAYQGALDNAPFGRLEEGATLVNHVEAAIADLQAGRKVAKASTKPYG